MSITVEIPPGMRSARRYAVEIVLGHFLGIEYNVSSGESDAVVIRIDDGGRTIRIRDVFFPMVEDKWLDASSLPTEVWPEWDLSSEPALETLLNQKKIPVVFGLPCTSGGYLECTSKTTEVGLDIFGSVFFLLTRYEEVVKSERDNHGRFPASASLLSNFGYLDRPLVDEYVELLWHALSMHSPNLRRKPHQYQVHLSHDIDYPSAYARKSMARVGLGIAADLVRRKDIALAMRRIKGYIAYRQEDYSADIYNTFDFIMSISESAGIQSAFYFIPLSSNRRLDGNYSLDDRWIRTLLVAISRRGHEIGVHSSYDSYGDTSRLFAEREKLMEVLADEGVQAEATGGRAHYLRWEPRESWLAWQQAGFSYDSTVGFAEAPGFRCGTCREFPVFDLAGDQPLPGLVERPLIAMDVTFSSYQRLSIEATYEAIRKYGQICRQFDGNMSLLWHNNNLITQDQRNLYKDVVAAL